MKKYNKLNNYLGDKLANGLSTMEAFYIVSAFVLLPLIWQRPNDLVSWIQYVCQSFFQGAALPILAYVSKIQGDKQEKLLSETHDNVMIELQKQNEEFVEMKEMLNLLRDENVELHTILGELNELLAKTID